MFRSATFKLTIWYLGLVMAISLVFSSVVYNLASNEIARGVHLQYQRIYDKFPVLDNDNILRPTDDISHSDHLLLLRLLFFNLIVLGLAGFASFWLAKRTLQPIEEAHEQQKRFTADVSHELRTPLTAIRMESEVALMSGASSKQELKETLESNLEEVTKLENLINNLLKLSRLEADELQQDFQTLDTKVLVGDVIKQVSAISKERNINITSELGDYKIKGDKGSLEQLILIIIDNAIKYSPSDSKIEIITKKIDSSIILSVSDNGIGIDKDSLEHIFERFYRADSSRTKNSKNEGYGLGLSIAKMIADVHGAEITISSQLNKGTSVEIKFPEENII